ncbi:hypothetical protein SUGI_0639260 [Cryptomeria japonica]|nr:hypothetical protein SUGI_0639260 [Cryptomeria japonica]
MSQTFVFVKNCDASYKSIPQDIEAPFLVKCNNFEGEEVYSDEKGSDGIIAMAMMVLCLSFMSIFTVPIALKNMLGLAGAREAMESLEFEIFVVMDSLSFFCSIGVVLVMIQTMGMNNISPTNMKRLRRMCSTVAHVAMGSAAIAFISAATALTRRL